jgi:hypothetical protein
MRAPLERNGGEGFRSNKAPAAMLSLARDKGVSYNVVIEAWRNDDLRRICELRSVRKGLNPSLAGWGARDGWDALAVLQWKRDPLVELR